MNVGFFALEGGEAVGKSTQLRRIAELLENEGFEVVVTREPGGTKIGDRIRAILLDAKHSDTIRPYTELLLLNASRHQWMHEIVLPAIEKNAIVLADRSFISTMVYQSYVEGIDAGFAKSICMKAMEGVIPDKVFLLDISLQTMMARLRENALEKITRYDTKEEAFHAKVREGYLAQIEAFPELIEKVDGEAPVEDITQHIFQRILSLMS